MIRDRPGDRTELTGDRCRSKDISSAREHPQARQSESDPLISFIIPAYNEQNLIEPTIWAIHKAIGGGFGYEIIVVDNGSSDRTAEFATRAHAKVISQSIGNIGALRNTGVHNSCGSVIVFLDADVVVTKEWSEEIHDTIIRLQTAPLSLVGSICDVPEDASWIERTWFAPRTGSRFSHVGTGHMILTRYLFDELKGFDESLATGEDYDFSTRARQIGASIVLDHRLRVEHMGYPVSIRGFFVRELWHGSSDFRSMKAYLGSRVALAASTFVGLHLVAMAGLLLDAPTVVFVAVLGVLALCASSSVWKFGGAPIRVLLANASLFYPYYLARALSSVYRPESCRSRCRRG